MKKDSMLYVVLFTFVVCAVFVVVLAVANESTKDRVAANKVLATRVAVLEAFGIPYDNPADVGPVYEKAIRESGTAETPVWKASVGGAEYVAIRHSGAGLWGTITVVLAATPDATTIRGIRILAQNETPGLGGRIEEPWFLGQYEGEKTLDGTVTMKAGAEGSGKADSDKLNSRVDGVSGATRTSQSFGMLVNSALAVIRSGGAR